MKSIRPVLVGALALLTAAPPATAQNVLRVPASGQKPVISFTKDATPAAPMPRLDLSPMSEAVKQDPDPTGLLGLAQEAESSGASRWIIGGLTFAGIGGAIVYYQMDQENQGKEVDDSFYTIGGTFMAIGAGLLVVGMAKSVNHSPHVRGPKRPGPAITAGVRIPIGRR